MAHQEVKGYEFYIDGMLLPFAPPSITFSRGANNETVTLLNNVEVNILKNPKLADISFEARIPRQKYPFVIEFREAKEYIDHFEALLTGKKVFKLLIVRKMGAKYINGTDLDVTLENYEITEDAEEGFDLLVKLEFKNYVEFGTNYKNYNKKINTVGSVTSNKNQVSLPRKYTIKEGDSLWTIAYAYYGDSSKWEAIYSQNRLLIETDAINNGRSSSSKGYYIYPGTTITIPKL